MFYVKLKQSSDQIPRETRGGPHSVCAIIEGKFRTRGGSSVIDNVGDHMEA
jgi:hypothetical protein